MTAVAEEKDRESEWESEWERGRGREGWVKELLMRLAYGRFRSEHVRTKEETQSQRQRSHHQQSEATNHKPKPNQNQNRSCNRDLSLSLSVSVSFSRGVGLLAQNAHVQVSIGNLTKTNIIIMWMAEWIPSECVPTSSVECWMNGVCQKDWGVAQEQATDSGKCCWISIKKTQNLFLIYGITMENGEDERVTRGYREKGITI